MKTFVTVAFVFFTALLVHGEKKSPDDINILCWVVISHGEYDNAKAMANSWGKRCNAFRIMQLANAAEMTIKNFTESETGNADAITHTNFQAYMTVFDSKTDVGISLKDVDWVLVVHTDSFVLVDNLRQILSKYDANSSHVFGCLEKEEITSTAYFQFGFLASRGAHEVVHKSLRKHVYPRANQENLPSFMPLEVTLNMSDFRSFNKSDLLITPKDLETVFEYPKHHEKLHSLNSVFLYFVPLHNVHRLKLLVDEMRTEKWIDLKIQALDTKILEEIEKKWPKLCDRIWSRSWKNIWGCIRRAVGYE